MFSSNELSNVETAKPQIDSRLVECKINCQQMTVRWTGSLANGTSHDSLLIDASFQVHSDQILAIIGQVGSGKVYKFIVLSCDVE